MTANMGEWTVHTHYKDGGSASVIPELSLWAACVIVRHLQSSVSPMQLWVTFQ